MKNRRDFPHAALEIGLERLAAGEELEEVLAEPDAQGLQSQGLQPQGLRAQDLRPALEAAQALQWLARARELPGNSLERSREAVLTAASQRRRRPNAQPYVAPVQMRQGDFPRPRAEAPAGAAPVSLRLSSLMGLLLLFLAGAAAASFYFSARTLPGDVLYPIKLASENLKYNLERDPLQRLALEQEFNSRRIAELRTLVQQARAGQVQRSVPVHFFGPLQVNSAENWNLAGIEVQVRPETAIAGRLENGFAAELQGTFTPEGRVLAQQVDLRRVEIEGALAKLSQAQWLVAEIRFEVTPETRLAGSVDSGRRVRVILLQEPEGRYVATWIEALDD